MYGGGTEYVYRGQIFQDSFETYIKLSTKYIY